MVNTTSTPIGWEDWGRARNYKVAGKGYIFTKNSQIHGQTHQLVMWQFTASCLLAKGRWGHLKITQVLEDVKQA